MQFIDTHKEGSEHDRQARELVLNQGSPDDTTQRRAVADTTLRRLLGPLRRRPVRRLLAGGLVSKTGDWLTVGALMGWMYQETGSTGSVALLMPVWRPRSSAAALPPRWSTGCAASASSSPWSFCEPSRSPPSLPGCSVA